MAKKEKIEELMLLIKYSIELFGEAHKQSDNRVLSSQPHRQLNDHEIQNEQWHTNENATNEKTNERKQKMRKK